LIFSSLCIYYVAVFRVYVIIWSIFFRDECKVIVYVASCPIQGCHVSLLSDSYIIRRNIETYCNAVTNDNIITLLFNELF
jgi:hypothetical protein